MVADITTCGITLSWHEATAVLLELLAQVPPDGAFPDPLRAAVLATGEIATLPTATVPGNPVAHAIAMLNQLLASGGAPSALRALADDAGDAARKHRTLDEFAAAVAYFERPNRRGVVAGVRGRVAAVVEKTYADRELERLRQKAVEAATAPPRRSLIRPKVKQAALVTGLCLLLAASVTALAWTVMTAWPVIAGNDSGAGTAAQGVPAILDSARAGFGQLIEAGRRTAGVAPSLATSTATTPPAGAPSHAAAASHAAPRTRGANAQRGDVPVVGPPRADWSRSDSPVTVSATSAVGVPVGGGWTMTIRELSPEEVEAAYLDDNAAEGIDFDDGVVGPIFSSNDSDVQPPVLVRPQLPSFPDMEGASLFDLLINEVGRVERLRLVSPGNRFNDRMLMAAAKAWLFQPALRHGQAVKYRVRMPIVP